MSLERSSDFVHPLENKTPKRRIVNYDDFKTSKVLSSSLSKGSSFVGGVGDLSTLMTHHSYSIVVGLQIANYSKYGLIDPYTKAIYGFSPKPAVQISSGSIELLIAHKRGYTMSGTNGIVSWLIEGTGRRAFVLWDCPYFSSNIMAVGFTEHVPDIKFKNEWYNDIVGSKLNDKLEYKVSTFDKTCEELEVLDKDCQFIIKGTMGGGNKPQINVEFQPKYERDLSLGLARTLKTKSVNF